MNRRASRGFTLVEVLLASGIFLVVLIVATDSLIDMVRNTQLDNLRQETNLECQRFLNMLESDLSSAGYRFTAAALAAGAPSAIQSNGPNQIEMRSLSAVGSTTAGAAVGANTLNVRDLAPAVGGYVIFSRFGVTQVARVTNIPAAGQITIAPALAVPLSAGAWIGAVTKIEYRILGGDLVRSVNDVIDTPHRVSGIIPAKTAFTFTMQDNTTVNSLPPGGVLNLRSVNFSLGIQRTVRQSNGHDMSFSVTANKRVTPRNI